jgi:flagellar L-ring protein precursor FlgH
MRRIAMLLAAAAVSATPAAALPFFGKKRAQPDYSATAAPVHAAPPANGAIFQAANGYAALTSGQRAAMVGDILTIVLVERTQATKTVASSTERSGNIGLTPPASGPFSFNGGDVTASGNNTFDGGGNATQSNQLNGEISVVVAAVYPNGTMLVRGEKVLMLNRGDENIRISGIVRAADISNDNRVLSTRVADARITYAGKGDFHRSSRPGWLQRFFSFVSPF